MSKEILEQVKDEYARNTEGYMCWSDLIITEDNYLQILPEVIDEISTRYAKKMLEVAAGEAKIERCNDGTGCGIPYCEVPCWEIDKKSILNVLKD